MTWRIVVGYLVLMSATLLVCLALGASGWVTVLLVVAINAAFLGAIFLGYTGRHQGRHQDAEPTSPASWLNAVMWKGSDDGR